MTRCAVRQKIVRHSWASAVGGRFSDAALLESAVGLATSEERRSVLSQALPLAWAKLDLGALPELLALLLPERRWIGHFIGVIALPGEDREAPRGALCRPSATPAPTATRDRGRAHCI